RSDLYALGLVLYEMFTGRKPFGPSRSSDTAPTNPSVQAPEIDPAVERVILRLLEFEPTDRPASALAVLAALPGGDPLAAALAAGETPSPEMVANAGEPGGLRPGVALALLGAVAVVLALELTVGHRLSGRSAVPIPKPPEVLAERARTVAGRMGWAGPSVGT